MNGHYSLILDSTKKDILSFWNKPADCDFHSALYPKGTKEMYNKIENESISEEDYIDDDLIPLEL